MNDDNKLGRGREIPFENIENLKNLIKNLAPYYYDMLKRGINKDQYIFRGGDDLIKGDKHIKVYQPKLHKRYPTNTENYYTEILSNSKYWSDYPKRSHSLIATTSYNKAKEYGDVYVLIPIENNCKLTISPKSDVWLSFDYALKALDNLFIEQPITSSIIKDFSSMGGFNNFLKTKFGLDDNETFSDLKRKVKLNKKFFKNLDKDSTLTESQFVYDKKELSKIITKWGSFMNYIEYLLSPKWNNFEQLRYNKNVILPRNREIWTECDSILISLDNHILLREHM